MLQELMHLRYVNVERVRNNMEDGADYLEEGCQRQTCNGCMAYNYCLIKEQENEQ